MFLQEVTLKIVILKDMTATFGRPKRTAEKAC